MIVPSQGVYCELRHGHICHPCARYEVLPMWVDVQILLLKLLEWTSTRITDAPSRQDCTCQKERVSSPRSEFIPVSFVSLPSVWCCPRAVPVLSQCCLSVASWSLDPRSGGRPRHALPHAAQLGPRPAAGAAKDGCQSTPEDDGRRPGARARARGGGAQVDA